MLTINIHNIENKQTFRPIAQKKMYGYDYE